MSVVILSKCFQLSLQIAGIPEEDMVKVFRANGSDESFNERMRDRCIRYGLNFVYTKNPQVRLPLVILEQRVVVCAEILRRASGFVSLASHCRFSRRVEHL